MKGLEKEIVVDNDETLKNVDEKNNLIKEYRYNNDSIQDFKQNFPEEILKLEEASLDYIGEIDLKFLKTELTDKWKNLTKK